MEENRYIKVLFEIINNTPDLIVNHDDFNTINAIPNIKLSWQQVGFDKYKLLKIKYR